MTSFLASLTGLFWTQRIGITILWLGVDVRQLKDSPLAIGVCLILIYLLGLNFVDWTCLFLICWGLGRRLWWWILWLFLVCDALSGFIWVFGQIALFDEIAAIDAHGGKHASGGVDLIGDLLHVEHIL